MNFPAIIAIVLAVLIIMFGHSSDSAAMISLIQPSAILIVLGGTFCASLLNFNLSTLKNALRASVEVFTNRHPSHIKVIDEIIFLSHESRKNGLLSLSRYIENIQDPFLKRGIQLSVDYNNPQMIHDILKGEIAFTEEEELINSRVFEALADMPRLLGLWVRLWGLYRL